MRTQRKQKQCLDVSKAQAIRTRASPKGSSGGHGVGFRHPKHPKTQKARAVCPNLTTTLSECYSASLSATQILCLADRARPTWVGTKAGKLRTRVDQPPLQKASKTPAQKPSAMPDKAFLIQLNPHHSTSPSCDNLKSLLCVSRKVRGKSALQPGPQKPQDGGCCCRPPI